MAKRASPITIDLEEVSIALEDHSGLAWYLDIGTGDVFPVSDDAKDDDLPVPRDELEDSDRFQLIEPLESRDGWNEMRAFADRVEDERLRELLDVALAGKGAFGRFKGVLAAHPTVQARWFTEHATVLEARARAWLSGLDLAWKPRPAGGRDAEAPR